MYLLSFTKDNNEINYIINNNNNFYGLNINKDGVGKFDKETFLLIMNYLRYNKDNCIRIKNYLDYEVYYNVKTGYNHYLKNNVEDHLMFLLKNGENGILYLNSEKIYKKCSKFLIGVLSVEICLSLVVNNLFLNNTLDTLKDYNNYRNDSDVSYSSDLIVPAFNSDYLIYKINNSNNLTDEEKTVLINHYFFEDILPYYEQSYMKYLINIKSNDIKINYYKYKNNGVDGYYHPLLLNDLFIIEDYKNEDNKNNKNNVLIHEFIHLLQSPCKYTYLLEAVAVIISSEYYSVNDKSYPKTTKNIKLLIDIIGPEPILKTCFSGDLKELENILADNLELSDYKTLINYLCKKPSDLDDNNHSEIREIICKLYKNMYNKDITEDEDILFNLYYNDEIDIESSKIFLNKSKMEKEEYNYYSTRIDRNKLEKMNILRKEEGSLVKRYISINDINNLKGTVYFESMIDNWYIANNMIYIYNEFGKINKEIPIIDAIINKIIKPYVYEFIPNNQEIPGDCIYVGNDTKYYSNYKNIEITTSEDIIILKISTKGIKERFKVNELNNNSNITKKINA